MDKTCKHAVPRKASAACQYLKNDGTVCGQPKTFGVEIIDEFNQVYENRLGYIDKEIGSDCVELKYPIYKDWVRDLVAQNKTFIQVLDELEREASHRFELLQTKLKNDTNAIGGDSRFKKIENDLKNLLILIKRALATNTWNIDDLEFQTVTVEDIFGSYLKKKNDASPRIHSENVDSESIVCIRELKCEMQRLTNELRKKDCVIEDYQNRLKSLQIEYNPSHETIDLTTGLEDKFKIYIDELKLIIKEKDAKNCLLLQENEMLKSIPRPIDCGNPQKDKNEFETITNETEPSEAQIKLSNVNCNDLDLAIVENCDRLQSDINLCNRLNQEISGLLTQIQCRETHICNQNSIICNFQEKLNDTRLQLKLITCERDQVCNKLSIIESEIEKIKDDIGQFPDSPNASNCESDLAICPTPSDDDDDPCKKKISDNKLNVLLHLKPMVNCMREKIVTLNRENFILKSSLSESQCKIDLLNKKLSTSLNSNRESNISKSCADKEVLVKINCNSKDSSDTTYHDTNDCCCTYEQINKTKEMCIQQFKSIFREFICKFGVDVDEYDLDCASSGDKKSLEKLVACIKETLQTKEDNSSSELDISIGQLREVLSTKESEIFDLKCKLTALNIEAENCSQAMRLNEDKVKVLSEEKDCLDLECKNQLTTIENLREAIEMVKRGHNITSPSYNEKLILLSEQLNCYFEDNMKMERQIDLLRDDNLELKQQLFDLQSDYASLEVQQQTDCEVSSRREKSIYKLLKKDLDQLKKQSTTIQSSLCNRETELKKLKYFRDRCLEMEINSRSELEMQKSHYTKIIKELHEELASLSDQLAEQQKESSQQNDLINDTSALENSITEIENQNDILQKTLCSYELRLVNAEDKCTKLKCERNKLKCEIEERDKTICDLKLEIDKLKLQQDNYLEDNNKSIGNRSTSLGVYDNSRPLDRGKRSNFQEEKNSVSREINEYCAQIEKLKNDICYLENLVGNRTNEVEVLNQKIFKLDKRLCQLKDDLCNKTAQVCRLEREEFKYKKIINQLSSQLAEFKKETECNEKHLITELNCCKEKQDEAEKLIKCLKQQYDKTHDELKNVKSFEESYDKENARLQKELNDANDRLIKFEGRGTQISNLLLQVQQDLQKEKDEVNRLKQIEYEFCKLREQNCKIYQHNCEMSKKLKNGECDYEKLAMEYKKLLDVKEQALAALKIARTWQTENCEREKLIKLKLQKNTEHIQTLTKDRKQLISKMNQMHRDELILRSEIDIVKEKLAHCRCARRYACTDTENSGSSTFNRVDRYSSDPEINDEQDDRCLKSAKLATKKIYRTRKFWQYGIKNACE